MNTRENKIFQVVCHIIMILLCFFVLAPFLLLIIASFTDEQAILQNGYSYFPKQFSLTAYRYLLDQRDYIFNAIKVSFIVTLAGTFIGMCITTMLSYTLSRRDFPLRAILSFIVFFTMLFNGGLVPTYLVYTNVLHVKNTFVGLIMPGLLMNGFFVILVRTFFATSIPEALIESARIDGAGEFLTFFRIVLPLSLPILATIGLMMGVNYWNDWLNGLYYITDPSLFSLQNLLNRMLQDVQFLQTNSNLGANAAEALSKIPTTTVRMAMAVVGAVPIMVAYPFFQKYFVKGITIGAVKG